MATVKRGLLVGAPQWWKHLRDWKRLFWERQRTAERVDAERQTEAMRAQRRQDAPAS
jgi:hypothetical protein